MGSNEPLATTTTSHGDATMTTTTNNATNQVAANIAFGVEFETTMPVSDTTPIGFYHNGLPVSWLPGWKVERDSSIRATFGRKPAEFVSGVMKGQAGLEQVKTACEEIKARGGKVNSSCGIHVTVSFDGDAAALARLVNLVANHERALYAMTGTTRRELGDNGRQWAKGVKQYGDKDNAKRVMDRDRYHMLNLTHIAAGRNRVEFRVFSGSLNADKIQAWVQICLGLVELAQRPHRVEPKFENNETPGKQAPWDSNKGGEGFRELRRLFYRLGWTKGRQSNPAGLVDNATAKQHKKPLEKLALKYDAERACLFAAARGGER